MIHDPWLRAARRVHAVGGAVCSVAIKTAAAVAMAGVARCTWAIVERVLERGGQ